LFLFFIIIFQVSLYLNALNLSLMFVVPALVAMVTMGLFVLLGNDLTLEKTMAILAYLNVIRWPLFLLPITTTGVAEGIVSAARIEKFLSMEELPNYRKIDSSSEFAIQIENGSFSWNPSQVQPTLSNINIQLKHGSLTAVIGTVASGKSSLIAALLGKHQNIEQTSASTNKK
jgi:ATP-binding cassette subfamily C (CFTR/MRP) protein 1